MILVDTSVWIDFFCNRPTPQAEWLDRHLAVQRFAIGDLILTEALQGFRNDRGFQAAHRLLSGLELVAIGGFDIAAKAAQNDRLLRRLGVTVRGTVDVRIATRCLMNRIALLHSDRDFDAMERHLARISHTATSRGRRDGVVVRRAELENGAGVANTTSSRAEGARRATAPRSASAVGGV